MFLVQLLGGVLSGGAVFGLARLLAHEEAPRQWLQLITLGWSIPFVLIAFTAGSAVTKMAFIRIRGAELGFRRRSQSRAVDFNLN